MGDSASIHPQSSDVACNYAAAAWQSKTTVRSLMAMITAELLGCKIAGSHSYFCCVLFVLPWGLHFFFMHSWFVATVWTYPVKAIKVKTVDGQPLWYNHNLMIQAADWHIHSLIHQITKKWNRRWLSGAFHWFWVIIILISHAGVL